MPSIMTMDGMQVAAFKASIADTDLLANWKLFANNAIMPIAMATPFGNQTFPSMLHYMAHMVEPHNQELLNKLLATDASGKVTTTPEDAFKIGVAHGQSVTAEQKELFESKHVEFWEAAQRAKLSQHFEVMDFALRATGAAVIVRDTTGELAPGLDRTSNQGYDSQRLDSSGNFDGILLMKLRNEIYQADIKAYEVSLSDIDKKITELMRPLSLDDDTPQELIDLQKEKKDYQAKLSATKALLVDENELSNQLRSRWKGLRQNLPTLALDTTLPRTEITVTPDAFTQQKFAALMALQPVAKASSVLSVKPKEVATNRLGAFDNPKRLAAMEQALQAQWPDIKLNRSAGTGGATFVNNSDPIFSVNKDSIVAIKEDVATFKAMLVAFKAGYPGESPRVTIEGPKHQAAWEKAMAETNIQAEIVVASPKTAKPDATPQPELEPPPAPRMR